MHSLGRGGGTILSVERKIYIILDLKVIISLASWDIAICCCENYVVTFCFVDDTIQCIRFGHTLYSDQRFAGMWTTHVAGTLRWRVCNLTLIKHPGSVIHATHLPSWRTSKLTENLGGHKC